MRFVRFDGDRLGLLTQGRDGVHDLTDRLDLATRDPLLEYLRSGADASGHAGGEADHAVSEVRLDSPIRRPGKIIAAPLNYEAHIAEAVDDEAIDLDDWFSIEDFGFFLKAPSSVVGPDDGIVLPFTDRRVDHEIELAFVIGEETKDVAASEAWDRIAGYTILLDISMRGEQDRSNRKSYDSFTVIGPCVATPDEVADPQQLDLRLAVDDTVRQDANTDDMVYTCADVVQYASMGTTLEPGDVITTGTPAGVGPLAAGDRVTAEIEAIGSMAIDVTARDVAFADHDVQKGGQR
jgi:2-keto-4-pentenoate hydratase/2-oxohepta-3-ene-1,7-dioic acid hydratase in catechol pathway